MEQKINIAEILKDCPKGMELDCILFEDTPAYFYNVTSDTNYPIEIKVEYPFKELETFFLNKFGCIYDRPTSKCVIFPKGKTTWEGFQRPFKDGDIVVHTQNNRAIISILKGEEFKHKSIINPYCVLWDRDEGLGINEPICFYTDETRPASKEEKAKLFQVIKDNGYKWNAEKKTLEKLVEPKFKVGDRIKLKNGGSIIEVTKINNDGSICVNDMSWTIKIKQQDNYELVPNKFDITTLNPFDKVLVRHNKDNKWCGSFFSHVDEDLHSHCYKFVTTSGKSYPYCIPYEANQDLLGTNKDCDDYYKTWEE